MYLGVVISHVTKCHEFDGFKLNEYLGYQKKNEANAYLVKF